MSSTSKFLGISLLPLALAGCFQTELGGTVTDAKVRITDLRSAETVEGGLRSLTEEAYVADRSQDAFDELDDLGKMINLGNFFVDGSLYARNDWYLITARGGRDLDPDANGSIEAAPANVDGIWHALITGQQLRDGNYVVSPLTEALYQLLKADLDSLDDTELRERLNQLSGQILTDVDNNGRVNYADALKWSTLANQDAYLRDFSQVEALTQAIRDNAPQATLFALAEAMFTDPVPDAFEYYQQNISGPIVQAICVRCHMPGGVAPNNGAELLLVTNNNANFQETNHQNFQNFGSQLPASRDLSDWVTGKASFRITHGGQRQLDPESEELRNLETYLNLIE
jgi:hypothetical protein